MASARAPFVAVRTDIRKEERVRFIADHSGYNEYEAIGRLTSLWCWCTDRGLEDAPDDCEGYAVPDAVVRRFLGPRGVEAILGDGCDELAMGARRPDDLIYLRGTSDTVDRLRSLRSTARSGGRSQAATGQRDQTGRFVSTATVVQLADQPESSRNPAALQPQPARSQIPDPIPEDKSSLPGAIPPAPATPPDRAAGRAPMPGNVNQPLGEAPMLWRELEQARAEAAADLRVEAMPLAFGDVGERDLADLTAAARKRGPAELDKFVRQARHAIAMAKLETVAGQKPFEWFTGAVFSPNNFRRLVGKTAATTVRAGPGSSAARAPEPIRKLKTL